MRLWMSGFLAGCAFIGLHAIVPNGGSITPAIGMLVASAALLFVNV